MDKSVHAGRIVTWHDSCKHMRSVYLTFGDDFDLEKPRKILSYLIDMENFREMPHNRLESYCCSVGAGEPAGLYEAEKTEHGGFKARDIMATGANLVVAGCSDCRTRIMKSLKPKFNLDIEVKYLREMAAEALIFV